MTENETKANKWMKNVRDDGSITIGDENVPFCINGDFLMKILFTRGSVVK